MDEQEARAAKVQTVVEPLLAAGDRYVVEANEEGEVTVQPVSDELGIRSILATTHPRLYGFLLASSQRISSSSGCAMAMGYIALACLACFALHAQALHGVFSEPGQQRLLDSLRSGWVYAILSALVCMIYAKHDAALESGCYRRERNELNEHLGRERLDAYEVLARMEGDEAISTLGKHMKLDPRLGSLGV